MPALAQMRLGYQIDRLQDGLEPTDWKSMKGIGAGVNEIRIATEDGAFRSVYVAKFDDAIYVLHCFQQENAANGQERYRSGQKSLQRSRK